MSALMHAAQFAAVAVLLTAAPAFAHDFWIEPSSFRPDGERVTWVGLGIGHNLCGVPVVRDRSQIEQFVIVGPNGEFPVFGRDGGHPAGLIRTPQPGIYIVGYHSKPGGIRLDPEQFEAYLKEEGLGRVIAQRVERDETRLPSREHFWRCAKTLIVSGEPSAGGFDKRLGFPLELVPLSNPMIASGEAASFLVLYDQKPCAGVQVVAVQRARPDEPLVARSDEHGKVSLNLERGGVWLIKAVHMVRATEGSGADWDSFWASLTFEREGSDNERATSRPATSPNHPADHLSNPAAGTPKASLERYQRLLDPRRLHRSDPATQPAR